MPENVFYSKASLSVNDSSSSEELRKALKKLSELEEYLMNLNKQNEVRQLFKLDLKETNILNQ